MLKHCRPEKETISINENVAEVKLQNLLNHTAKRILEMQAKVVHIWVTM